MVTVDPGAVSTDRWIGQHAAPIRETLEILRRIVQETAPHLRERVVRGLPTWEGQRLVCYLDGNGVYARLGFFRGAELDDPEGRLEDAGGAVRHLECRGPDDVPVPSLRRLLEAAIAFDDRS